ncbi:hypothetical protein FA13DRAFT_1784684 [Coprinellus micaceus]|uniref:F-box domain-containing protein n=1 Tax=Coprinellus micaceus TaxID=71717 RepID=A0A4Y7U2P5_COPMI|nr:hypothetical protein FA13DRAFT_1784684 [Coprinellus micaceus]
MAQVESREWLQLPPELWQRILRGGHDFDRQQIKSFCLVCRLFADTCQPALFQEVAVHADAGTDYKNPNYGRPGSPWRSPDAKRWPVQEWKWEEWEKDMRNIITSERRLTLIGGHDVLATQPKKLTICGYGFYRGPYPPNPFRAPSNEQMLSRAVFDALLHFQQALLKDLPSFSNLRRLELFKYPVESILLAVLDSHPSLTELRFVFCWFPESTSPLTSITTLSFGFIPGSHALPLYFDPDDDNASSPYDAIPDHHVASAFDLISPPHIEYLDVTFGSQDSAVEPVFKKLVARTSGHGEFQRLQSLLWNFADNAGCSFSTPLIFQFLERTPALRKLTVQGYPPSLPINDTFPTMCLPILDTLDCPLHWARVLVPGRPLQELRLYRSRESSGPAPSNVAQSVQELDDCLRPLTLSTSTITTLHLPSYPAPAPVWFLFPYLAARFPFLCDLRVAVAGEVVANRYYRRRCGTRAGPPSPFMDATKQLVEEGLLEVLEQDVRKDVETTLTGNPAATQSSRLPYVLDRIMAFRGVEAAVKEEPKPPPSQPFVLPLPLLDPSPRASIQDNPLPIPSIALAPLDAHFAERDPQTGIPLSKPQTALDLVYFFARGHYPLPSTIQSLTLYSCFEEASLSRYSRASGLRLKRLENWSKDQKEEELCTKAALEDLSQRGGSLSVLRHNDVSERGRDRVYCKTSDSLEGGPIWCLTPEWERPLR